MFKFNLSSPIHVHFIGIGGISMSGLAEILLQHHFTVSGSDLEEGITTQRLSQHGATIYYGHTQENLSNQVDLVVYTVAVKSDNPEMIQAKMRHLPIIDRATLLGYIMDGYKKSMAVAGTHGKTTTTSMIAHILDAAKTDPTISVGGILPLIDGNIQVGHSAYFVTEACEYYDSFHQFRPFIGLVLNVEEDHLDYFQDLAHIRRSFKQFINNIQPNGTLIINKAIPHLDMLLLESDPSVLTYSLTQTDADYYVQNIRYSTSGFPEFDIYKENKLDAHMTLSVPGTHNISNALAAYIAGTLLDLPKEALIKGLGNFAGTQRRFQFKGSLGGVTIIDDYAHHPTEIKATLESLAPMQYRKLWIIFQPHTYSRTQSFLDDFGKVLAKADHVILMDIYSASREKDLGVIHSRDLQKKIQDYGTSCEYFESWDEIMNYILTHCRPKDLLITMGAGDVYLIGDALLHL